MMNLHGLLLSLFLHGALAFAVGSHLMGEDLPPSPPHAIEVVFEKPKPSLSPASTHSHHVNAKRPLDPTVKPSSRGLTTGSNNHLSLDTAIEQQDEDRYSDSEQSSMSSDADKSRPCTPPFQHASHEGLSNPLPSYPLIARKRGHEGSVTLRLKISEKGSCDGVQIKTSSGSSYLDEAASAAVRSWRFTPALRGSAPTTDAIEVTFDFRLSGVEVH